MWLGLLLQAVVCSATGSLGLAVALIQVGGGQAGGAGSLLFLVMAWALLLPVGLLLQAVLPLPPPEGPLPYGGLTPHFNKERSEAYRFGNQSPSPPSPAPCCNGCMMVHTGCNCTTTAGTTIVVCSVYHTGSLLVIILVQYITQQCNLVGLLVTVLFSQPSLSSASRVIAYIRSCTSPTEPAKEAWP